METTQSRPHRRSRQPALPGVHDVRRKTSPDDSYKIIDRAISAGINFLDTANVYNDGSSEK